MTSHCDRSSLGPQKWRNGTNLGFVILIIAVLGCSCPKLTDLAKGRPTPAPSATPYNDFPTPPPTSSKGAYDVTMAKFNKLSKGMARADVERILGGKGTEVSSSTGGGVRFSVNKWEGDSYKSIILSFQNDKIMTKAQVGLK